MPCLFNVEVNEKEKEKERNDLVYGNKRLDLKAEDGQDLTHMEMLCRENITQIVGAKVEGCFASYLDLMEKKHEVQNHAIQDGIDEET